MHIPIYFLFFNRKKKKKKNQRRIHEIKYIGVCINHFPYQIFKVVNELLKDESDKSEQCGMLQGTSTAYPEVQEMVVRSEGYGGLPHYNNATWPI